jgi:Ca2+-transporting ATPase
MGFVALGIALAGLAGIAVEAGVYFFTKRARVRGLNGSPRSVVWRDSILVSVAPIEVVVGDVVELAPGIRVAADARLLVATNLCCKSEAGDVNSNGLQRSVSILPVAAVGTARTNMVFAGDRVTSGSGRAVIVSTS